VLSALGEWLTPGEVPGGVWLWQAVSFLVSLGLITMLFALIFKLLPDAPVAWGDVWGGAVLTAVLFSIGKYLIGIYLAHDSMASASGAAGSLVVVLVWVYFSAQLLLYGAEVTHSYATRFGSLRGTTGTAGAAVSNGAGPSAANGAPVRKETASR
jgi:membrane protein